MEGRGSESLWEGGLKLEQEGSGVKVEALVVPEPKC